MTFHFVSGLAFGVLVRGWVGLAIRRASAWTSGEHRILTETLRAEYRRHESTRENKVVAEAAMRVACAPAKR